MVKPISSKIAPLENLSISSDMRIASTNSLEKFRQFRKTMTSSIADPFYKPFEGEYIHQNNSPVEVSKKMPLSEKTDLINTSSATKIESIAIEEQKSEIDDTSLNGPDSKHSTSPSAISTETTDNNTLDNKIEDIFPTLSHTLPSTSSSSNVDSHQSSVPPGMFESHDAAPDPPSYLLAPSQILPKIGGAFEPSTELNLSGQWKSKANDALLPQQQSMEPHIHIHNHMPNPVQISSPYLYPPGPIYTDVKPSKEINYSQRDQAVRLDSKSLPNSKSLPSYDTLRDSLDLSGLSLQVNDDSISYTKFSVTHKFEIHKCTCHIRVYIFHHYCFGYTAAS